MSKVDNGGSAIAVKVDGTIEGLKRAICPNPEDPKDWSPVYVKTCIEGIINGGDLGRLLEALIVCANSNRAVNRLGATDEDEGVTAEIWDKLFPVYGDKIKGAASDVDLDGISDPQAILKKIRKAYWPCGVFNIMAEAVKATIDEKGSSESTDTTTEG